MKRFLRIALLVNFALLLGAPVFAKGDAEGGAGKAPVGPTDQLEFVSCFGPGGGHDLMLRNIEKAIRANNIIQNPIVYTYKPGGNQAVGMQYTKTQGGRPDIIMATTNQLIGVPLQADIGVKREDLTDLCIWGEQTLFFWVLKDSPYKTFDDLVKTAKSGKPITFTISGGVGAFEGIIVEYLQSQIPGADFRTVAVDGDAEGMTQLLGHHVDVFVNELSGGGSEGYVASGELIALMNSGPTRSTYQPNVPTLKELGYDFALTSFRGVMGPPNMSKEAIAYWDGLFGKVKDTREFKEYITQSGIEPNFLTGDALHKYFDDYKANLITAFKVGGVKMVANP
jgi:putative tricarboxylic transport membrane protein